MSTGRDKLLMRMGTIPQPMPMSMDTIDMMLRLELTQEQRLGLMAAASGSSKGRFSHLSKMSPESRAAFAEWQKRYRERARAARRDTAPVLTIGPYSDAELARRKAEGARIADQMSNVYDFAVGKSRVDGRPLFRVPRDTSGGPAA